ncbi:MAG: HAD family hydrolase [Alphaproteobacteria bacterium]|nr:HAD family hydrolase [Alphaproteobacteria bacterium]
MAERPAELDNDLVWVEQLAPSRRAPALFLDRDGVIVEEVLHLREPAKARLIAGAAEVIQAARARGLHVVVVTNQSGIGQGLFGWEEFRAVQHRMLADLAELGAAVDAVLACPYHPQGLPPYRHANHPARKPNPGMLLKAAAMLRVELGGSWIVGDRAGDLAAGRAAGLPGGLHVETGFGPEQRPEALALAGPSFRVLAGASVADALELLPILR